MRRVLIRKGLSVLVCYTLTLLHSAIAGDGVRTAHSLEKKNQVTHAEAHIESISWSGGDEYRIVITLMNRSSRDITVKEFERGFFVQTEKGWKGLEATVQGEGKNVHLPAGKAKKIEAVVRIPLSTKDLFRTYEGDISFMFAYLLRPAGSSDTVKNERLYWIKPMTGTWIEREGM